MTEPANEETPEPDERREPDAPAWMTEDEARLLWDRASVVPAGGNIVEIGGYHGGPTDLLRQAAPSSATVRTVDCEAGAVLTEEVAGGIDLLYVDGAHDFRTARDQLRAWCNRVEPGGTLLVHDSLTSFGVALALLSTVVTGDAFRFVGRAGSVTEFRRERPAPITSRLRPGPKLTLPPGAIKGFDPAHPLARRERAAESAPGPSGATSEHATPKVKVLFVLSAGRSGSTLLDRLLGQYPSIEAVGELYAIWEHGVRKNPLCGCGVPFRECPLWVPVFDRAFGGLDNVNGGAMEEFWRRNDRMFGEHLPRLATEHGRHELRDASDCTPVLEALYTSIAAETGAELIVDTSKSVFHPYFMLDSPVVDPYVLHLVRDPRGVVFSWTRPKEELGYGKGKLMPQHSLAVSTGWWIAINQFAAGLEHDAPNRYEMMRYEDFVADPQTAISSIGDLCGMDIDPALLFGAEAQDLHPTHGVWGNPMRFQGKVQIRADERWRRELQPRERRIITAATYPWLSRYGY